MPQPFEEIVSPHLDAAFNYARWLTRNDADAEDVVQDAAVRALRFLPTRRTANTRAWLLTIVRNTWYSRFSRRDDRTPTIVLDDMSADPADPSLDPEARAVQLQTVDRVRAAVDQLPADFREVIVLRELEGLSYKEIAEVVGVPIGTVMSRLARARDRLIALLGAAVAEARLP